MNITFGVDSFIYSKFTCIGKNTIFFKQICGFRKEWKENECC